VIRYIVALAAVLLFGSAYAQSDEPEFSAAQLGKKTVIMLPSDWSVSALDAEITFTSSKPIVRVAASDWWNATEQTENSATFSLQENVDRPSKFVIFANSTGAKFSYEMTLNSTSYSGRIALPTPKASEFSLWTDSKEGAASAFLPQDWRADLQIIRPYNSMSGFVFFARGADHALVYVFQPFMPLHISPGEPACELLQACSGTVSAEKARDFGNAPIMISGFKTPAQYFESEVLPVLRKNLNGYSVESADPSYAMVVNNTDVSLAPALDVKYSFDVEGGKVAGRAMVITRNYTDGDTELWNGFIVGVESLDKNFVDVFQQSAVTLLTLQFDEKWLQAEKQVLLENAASNATTSGISTLMANGTIDDFSLLVPAAAHSLVRTYNDTMVAGFEDSDTGDEIRLPLFPDSQRWYLSNDTLVGKKSGKNPLGNSTLEPLF
jgi:hypothetical protein